MDGLSGAASVIAVIDIAAKITSICYHYAVAVKNAKDDIESVQNKVTDITNVLEKLKQLLDGPGKARFPATHEVFDSLNQCLRDLQKLQADLEPKKARKAMSRLGFRALKWPFSKKQVENILSKLERYEQTFTLALQVDQM